MSDDTSCRANIGRRLAARCCGSLILGIGLAALIGLALALLAGGDDTADTTTTRAAALFPDSDRKMQDITRALLGKEGEDLGRIEPAAGDSK